MRSGIILVATWLGADSPVNYSNAVKAAGKSTLTKVISATSPIRVRHWERQTELKAQGARVRHFQSRWASCNAQNVLEFYPRVMELPASIQDYVILHELCHTVEKSHTKGILGLGSTIHARLAAAARHLRTGLFGRAV